MRVSSNRVVSPTAVDRARSSLVTLANAVGLDGLAAAAARPGLLAAAAGAPIDWAEADWVTVRLLAVCALTAALDTPAAQPPPL